MVKFVLTYDVLTYDRDYGERTDLSIEFDSETDMRIFQLDFLKFCQEKYIIDVSIYSNITNNLDGVDFDKLEKLHDKKKIPEHLDKNELRWFDTGEIYINKFTMKRVEHEETILERSK